jgi:integrase
MTKGGKAMKFTKSAVEKLALPVGKNDFTAWDDETPNLGIRLREGGSKRWVIYYRIGSEQRRESLGDYRTLDIEAARKAAKQRFAQLALGIDPKAQKVKDKARTLTLAKAVERYLDFKRDRLRPASFEAAQLHLTTHWGPLLHHPLDSIKRADVAAELQVISKERGPVAAQRARANLSSLLGWCCREGLIEVNCAANTNNPAEGRPSRDRVLNLSEIRQIWIACEDCGGFGNIVRLLLLTGQRRCEISDAKWHEIDFDKAELVLPAERVKNKRSHTVSLSAPALSIFKKIKQRGAESDRVFATLSWTRSKAALDRRIAALGMQLQHWTLHDARRSVATHMAEIGVQPHVVEQILNHQSGHKAGVAGTYNRASYATEVRSALAQWAEALLAAVENRQAKVTPLRRA